MKLLIVKLSAIGDVIHALPVASYLKRAIPGLELTWLVEQMSASLVQNNSAIDEAMVFQGKKWVKEFSHPQQWMNNLRDSQAFFADLRQKNFDAAIDLQGLFKSSFLARASNAKIVAGFDDTREFADRFLTDKLNVGNYFGHDVPVVELNLAVAKFVLDRLGLPQPVLDVEFPLPGVSAQSKDKISELLSNPRSPEAPYVEAAASMAQSPKQVVSGRADSNDGQMNIVLIPGTTWVTKIWPTDKWVGLASMLGKKYNARFILVGGKSEAEANAIIHSEISKSIGSSVLNLTGQTTLLDLIPLFRSSALVIGGDTGPLHLAAATGMPRVIGVFGSTPWRRNGPYGAHCKTISLSLECQPCYSKTCKFDTVDCLRQLSADQVFESILATM